LKAAYSRKQLLIIFGTSNVPRNIQRIKKLALTSKHGSCLHAWHPWAVWKEGRWGEIKPKKNKGVPLPGHPTACRPACPFLGHSPRSKFRFSSGQQSTFKTLIA